MNGGWRGTVLAVLCLLPGCRREDAGNPSTPRTVPTSGPEYRQALRLFYRSLGALKTEAQDQALRDLQDLVKLAPGEAAAWANLGWLQAQRGMDSLEEVCLQRAVDLAPRHPGIRLLLAARASRRGQAALEREHLRQVLAQDPTHPRALYALAEAADREHAPEARIWMDSLARTRPGNLPAALERLRLALHYGASARARLWVDSLPGRPAEWPPEAQARLAALRATLIRPDSAQADLELAFLRNVLVPTSEYQRGWRALTPLSAPLENPVALPLPPALPAPADTLLAFQALPDTSAALDAPKGVYQAQAALAWDWNNDFRMDWVLGDSRGLKLYARDSGGAFHDASAALGREARLPCRALATADLDVDGDLDLVVLGGARARVLWNNGDGTFRGAEAFSEAVAPRAFLSVDLDQDGVAEVCLLDSAGALHLFAAPQPGEYRHRGRLSAEVTHKILGMAAADLDGDGRPEITALREDGRLTSLSLAGEGGWRELELAAWEPPRAAVGEARIFSGDWDNNGGLDLAASARGKAAAWLSRPEGPWHALELPSVDIREASDGDGDGRLDFLALGEGGSLLRLRNQGRADYGWQTISLRASRSGGDRRMNAFGVGGEVEARTGLLYQKRLVTGPEVHFGLGRDKAPDLVRVLWPNGIAQIEISLTGENSVEVGQRLKGSCPWIFAFDGGSMAFVTDFLWRSPLGLRINAQANAPVAQTADRVKIGAGLAPREGRYDVRVTAELWETHFFDQLSLLAVDHPQGTEVYVDERFAFPIPPLDVRLTGTPRPAPGAWDQAGQDVTATVASRDGIYLETFARGPFQGLAEDHWVELDLGPAPEGTEEEWLVAQGWIYPTDSSINRALGQGKHPRPRGLSLEVKEGKGWRTARPDLGFPAGKNKTALIPLRGLFRPGQPRRVRLRTNLEIYWDRLALARDLDPAALRIRPIRPDSARLRFAGFSPAEPRRLGTPELPRYGGRQGGDRWRDLEGYYTRYGDVGELLAGVDDRYVIMNAGDEIVLRFPALPPPEAGLVRDFFLDGDGWEKDGDFNTGFARTVLPLPSHDNPAYAGPETALAADPVFRRHSGDWLKYHTRYVGRGAFASALLPAGAAP